MPPTPAAAGRPDRRCSRRSLLRTGVLGGGAAAVLAAAGTRTGAPAAAAAAAGAPAPVENLFTLADLDFDTLFAFGGTGYGSAEFGELARAVDQVNTAGASYQTYYGTFLALAQRTAARAGADLAAGRRASARSGYLRAASYYDLCLYFILGTTARAGEAGAYAAMQRCWHQASQLFDPPFEPVRIPCGGSWLLQRADLRRPRAGLDAVRAADPVPARLGERHHPVVDYLRSRPEVDPSRIVLNGSSLGGELVVRAAAFEHRLAALVADPGFLSVWLTWQTKLEAITSLFTQGLSKEQINAAWQQKIVPTLDAGERFSLAKTAEGYGRPFLRAARAGQVFTDLYALGTDRRGGNGGLRHQRIRAYPGHAWVPAAPARLR